MAVLTFLVPILVVFAFALLRWFPFSGDRQNIILIPMIYVIAGMGFESLLRAAGSSRLQRLAIGVSVVLAISVPGVFESLLVVREEGPDHLRPVAQYLADEYKPGDNIYLACRSEPGMRYYFPQGDGHWIVRGSVDELPHPQSRAMHLFGELDETHNRVWIVMTRCSASEQQALIESAALAREGRVTLAFSTRTAWLYLAT